MTENNASYAMGSSDHASEYRENTMNSVTYNTMPPPDKQGANNTAHNNDTTLDAANLAGGADSIMQVVEDAEERQMLEQMNKDREIEKQYQKLTFIIPSCASWFEFSTIHEIEM